MAGPVNGIVGSSFGPEIEEADNSQMADESLAQAKRLAAFVKSKEFNDLEEVVNAKIERWKSYIPGASGEILAGDAVPMFQLNNDERGSRWIAADSVIRELQGLLDTYRSAAAMVKDDANTL